jgi:hypothetical protein
MFKKVPKEIRDNPEKLVKWIEENSKELPSEIVISKNSSDKTNQKEKLKTLKNKKGYTRKDDYKPVPKVSIKEWDDFKILTSGDSDFWFGAAKWGKETEKLKPGERGFVFRVGVSCKQDNPMSEKQVTWAKKLFKKLNEVGYPK